MKKYTVLFIIAVLLGGYLARSFFPTTKTNTVVRRVTEEAPPEVVERVVFDTTYVTKWKTRVLYKTLRPREVLEIPHVEIPGLQWGMLALTKTGESLTVDTYNYKDSSLVVAKYDQLQHDYKIRLNQYSEKDPVVVIESRDLFDIVPKISIGYAYRQGPFLQLRQRVLGLHVEWEADPSGLDARAYVRLW